jgi:hypothetical protein
MREQGLTLSQGGLKDSHKPAYFSKVRVANAV